MKTVFNIANLFTAANMLSGVVAILFAFMGRIDLAPFAIFAGALFDFFDGFLARRLGNDPNLGKQLDSLADMVTFGLAPGMIIFVILTADAEYFLDKGYYAAIRYDFFEYLEMLLDGEINYAVPFLALSVPFFALFRLAKFNVDERQSDSFIGLPSPANALFLMTFPLVLSFGGLSYDSTIEFLFDSNILAPICLLSSLTMVLPIPLFSLKFKSFGLKGNEMRYSFLLISVVFILIFKTWSIALIVFLYLILSMIENLFIKKKEHEI